MRVMSMSLHRRERPDLWHELPAGLVRIANDIGRALFDANMRERLGPKHHTLEHHQVGMRGQLAAGAWVGMDIDAVIAQMRRHGKGSADLGRNLGVRTRAVWHYELNVMPQDRSELKYLLVTEVRQGSVLWHVMRGWLTGARAKQVPLRDHGKLGKPGHFVPESWLNDPVELRECVRQAKAPPASDETPEEMMRAIGRAAFGIEYDERGMAK